MNATTCTRCRERSAFGFHRGANDWDGARLYEMVALCVVCNAAAQLENKLATRRGAGRAAR